MSDGSVSRASRRFQPQLCDLGLTLPCFCLLPANWGPQKGLRLEPELQGGLGPEHPWSSAGRSEAQPKEGFQGQRECGVRRYGGRLAVCPWEGRQPP